MNITSLDGATVSRSCRSSLAPYRSPLLRGLETVAFLPALLTGGTEQQLPININFFDAFHPDPHMVAQNIHVELKSHLLQVKSCSQYSILTSLMQVTRVSLQLEASLSGLRHVMYRHPWVSAVLGVGTNILILLTIIAVSWTRFRMQGSGSTVVESSENEQDNEDEEEDNEGDAATEDNEGLEGPEYMEVPDARAAGSVAQQTLSNRFKWFVIKFIFKVSFRTNSHKINSCRLFGTWPGSRCSSVWQWSATS
jgi:seipin